MEQKRKKKESVKFEINKTMKGSEKADARELGYLVIHVLSFHTPSPCHPPFLKLYDPVLIIIKVNYNVYFLFFYKLLSF